MRLKSRTKYPAGGFQMLFPQSGMTKPFSGSFAEAVRFTHNFFSKNPALVEKNGWSLDITYIENFVDQYNAQRMVAAGYFNFVDLEGAPASIPKVPSRSLGGVAGAVAKAKTALSIYKDLFGDGKTVAPAEAERRATICSTCPKNDKTGGFTKYFTEALAKSLMGALGMMKDLNLHTSLDSKLGVCSACACPLQAKTWVEPAVLKKNLSAEDIAKLDPRCWIPGEIAKA